MSCLLEIWNRTVHMIIMIGSWRLDTDPGPWNEYKSWPPQQVLSCFSKLYILYVIYIFSMVIFLPRSSKWGKETCLGKCSPYLWFSNSLNSILIKIFCWARYSMLPYVNFTFWTDFLKSLDKISFTDVCYLVQFDQNGLLLIHD